MIPVERESADLNCWYDGGHLHGFDRLINPQAHPLFNPAKGAMPQANTVIYISGKISADTSEQISSNKQVFHDAQKLLCSLGCTVFNPAHIEGPIDKLSEDGLWQYYMHFCVRAIPQCGGIFLLPGWQNSRGAKLEKKVADSLGLAVFYAPVYGEGERGSAADA